MELFKSIQKINNKAILQTKKQPHQTNEKGFLLVTVIAFLPLTLSLCLLIVSFTHYSYLHIQALNICRKHLLIGQDKIRYQMKKLIKLNPKATKLRIEHKVALARLAASGNPAIFAANLKILNSVRKRQKLFAAIQKRHIFIAKSKAKIQENLVKRKIVQLNSNANVEVSSFPFALKAEPKTSLTPSYTPAINFSHQQSVNARWTIKNVNQKFYTYLNNITPPQPISAYCGATIKKGTLWRSALTKKGKL